MTDFTAYLRLGVDSRDAVTAQKDLDRMAAAGDKSEKSFKQLSSTSKILGASIGGIGLAAATAQVINYADAWTNVSNVLMGASDSSAAYATTQAKVLALSKDTFSSLDSTARLYSEITRSVSELGVTQEQVIGVTRTINNLFLAGGKSAAAASAAILQLNQGFASGVLRGDEFNSVAEGAPRILDAVSKYLNISRGDLRDFAADGKITAEVLIGALEDYSDEAQKAVDTTTRTFSQSAELARTFALEFVGANESIKEFSATAGSALVTVAQNLDLVSDAVIVLSVAYGSRLAGSLATAAAAKASSIAAARALAIAENDAAVGIARRATVEAAAAKVALDKARADNIAATATLNNVRANGIATQSVAPLIAALNAQAVAQQKLTAAIGGSAAATAAANAANAKLAATGAAVAGTTALATAARGLGAAMALLGGPVGVAVLAGAAIYYFATQASDAEKAAADLNPEVEGLAERYRALGAAQQELARQGIEKSLRDQQKEVDNLAEKLERLNKVQFASGSTTMGFGGGSLSKPTQQILETSAELEKAQEKLKSLQSQFDSIKPPTAQVQNFVDSISSLNNVLGFFVAGNGVSKPFSLFSEGAANLKTFSEEYTKLSADIEKQIALFGDEKKSSELAYLARTGQLKKITQEEAALLIERYKVEEQLKETADKTKELEDAEKSRADSIASSIAELEKQNALFGEQSKYADILYDIENGLLKVTDAERARYLAAAQTSDQLAANKNLADSMASFAKQSEDDKAALDELITSVDEFGGAWSRTGSIVADALGGIGDALDDYSSRMGSIAAKESELAKARAKFMGDPKELEKISSAEKKLASERTKANLSSFGAIAGAASDMFDEQSKARKTLHGIEVAFSAIEMAMTIQRSFLAAKEAVLTQGKGDPYTAFARMAAMAAAVGALGYAVGGGFGGGGGQSAASIQEQQGTGSVLGSDEKSESILNAFEAYEDIGIEQLAELRGIREGLLGLTGGINRLSVGVITSGLTEQKYLNFAPTNLGSAMDRGFLETFGSRKQDVAGREMLAPLQGQIMSIFSYIEESIFAATDMLGLSTANSVRNFLLDIGKISFQDLSGEEIESELNAIFSMQADLIAEFIVPAMKDYQQIGEGLFDTLTRVAKEMATFNYYTDALGISFNLTGLAAIDAQQSIAEFSGGMDKLTENLQTYYEEFFTEEERAANQMKLLSAELKNLGYDTVPESREAFRAMVEGIDLTTEAGQKQFSAMMSLSEVFADLVPATENATNAAMSLLERSVEAEKKIIGDQISILNSALGTSRSVFNALESSLRGMTISSARTATATRAEAQRQLGAMLSSARGGTLPELSDLTGVLAAVAKPNETMFATFEDYATDLYRTAGQIKELKDIAGEQVSTDEKALSELQKQSEFLDDIVVWGREQLDIMSGVDTRITSVADALNNLSAIIGVTYPTTEQQRVIAQIAQSSEQSRADVAAAQERVNQAQAVQQSQMKEIADYVKAALLSIADNTDKTKKVLEKFDAIGMSLRDESIAEIVDPIVDAVTP